MKRDCQAIVLAAGKGTRMKSDLPKVLHPLGGRPMLEYVLDCAEDLGANETVVVINPEMEDYVEKTISRDNLHISIQDKQLGTAHAVLSARKYFQDYKGILMILFGDTPSLTAETLEPLLDILEDSPKAAVGILGMYPENKRGYARIELKDEGTVNQIIEVKDATEEQLALDFCNSGVMALKGEYALSLLEKVQSNNAAGEFYLTDVVSIANSMNLDVHVVEGDEAELAGINSKTDLAEVENTFQNHWRHYFLEEGVTLLDPSTVYFSYDTFIGQDCVIEPNVVFGPGVRIGNNVTIKAFSYLSEARLMEGATVGPFAHLRPGTKLQKGAKVGNFVEVKNSILHENVKANHLSYIGDSEIGRGSNIGAGTITCNYDGYAKHKTQLGENVFIGSNSSLVAPIRIGDHAIVGAGSVITKDVPDQALSVARGEQKTVSKGAKRFRDKRENKRKTA